MRIAMVTAAFDGQLSGVECFLYELSVGLRARGHETWIYAAEPVRGTLAERLRGTGEAEAPELGKCDVAIAQLRYGMARACEVRIPVVEVLHSESSRPHAFRRIRASVGVRAGISDIASRRTTRPVRTIHNPIDFSRFPRANGEARPRTLFFPSAIEEHKLPILERLAPMFDRVEVMGRLGVRSPLPANVSVELPNWGAVPERYRQCSAAFSYRLSRCLVEAHLSGRPAYVLGHLEPSDPTGHDEPDLRLLQPGTVDLERFRRERVAAEWEALLMEVLS